MKDYYNSIKNYIELEKTVLDNLDINEINRVINVLENAFENEIFHQNQYHLLQP